MALPPNRRSATEHVATEHVATEHVPAPSKASLLKNFWEAFSADPSHPGQVALRSYLLILSLAIGPSIFPAATSIIKAAPDASARLNHFKRMLKREISLNGSAFALTLASAGGITLQRIWDASLCAIYGNESFDGQRASSSNVDEVARDQTILHKVKLLALHVFTLPPSQRSFLANLLSSLLAILVFQRTRHRPLSLSGVWGMPLTVAKADIDSVRSPLRPKFSPTLDLTLLFFVRAMDSFVQSFSIKRSKKLVIFSLSPGEDDKTDTKDGTVEKFDISPVYAKSRSLTGKIDAFVFWACSARIMWCFFYEPERLPRSYVKWITSLAQVDRRLLQTLRAIRSKEWSYTRGSLNHAHLLTSYCTDLGLPTAWGDPSLVPAFGGPSADAAWKALGLRGRNGVGGVPCELVHAGVAKKWGLGDSCFMNAVVRGAHAFIEAIALYLPVHFLPILLRRPQSLLKFHRTLSVLRSALQSATFLSTFLASYWSMVCLTRTVMLAKAFPWISHDFWDGPFGCMLAGSLMCGGSIWIENNKRRGEMALYVLPRAIRASLPDKWLRNERRSFRIVERLVFVLSLASLLSAGIHQPDSLRGLSRWALAVVLKGPNIGFLRTHRDKAANSEPISTEGDTIAHRTS